MMIALVSSLELDKNSYEGTHKPNLSYSLLADLSGARECSDKSNYS